MLSGRLYTASFQNVSISATQALLTVYANSAKIVGIRSISLGQVTQSTQTNLRLRLQYVPATVTTGSGGTSATFASWLPGDAAASSTCRVNDTTPATSSGTIVDLWSDTWNLINGFIWMPPVFTEPPACNGSEALMVIIDTAPGSAITCNGSLVIEEIN